MAEVPHDFCVYTPLDPTVSVEICPNDISTPFVDTIEGKALDEANYVNALIATINTNADTAAAAALVQINALRNYSAPLLPTVNYTAPTWDDPAIHATAFGPLAVTSPGTANDGVGWTPPSLNEVTEPTSTVSAPTTESPDMPEFVPNEGAAPTLPSAPSEYDPTIGVVPTFTAADLELDSLVAPVLEEFGITLPDPIALDSLSVSIDTTLIDEAIDRFQNVAAPAVVIPEYVKLIPEVFNVVGGMLSGQGIDTTLVGEDDGQIRRVAPLLARRGLKVPDYVVTYDEWFQSVMDDYVSDSATLHQAKYADEVLLAGYDLATAAEDLLINLERGIWAAEFAATLENARASLEIAKGVASAYGAEVLSVEAAAVQYNAELAALKAYAKAVIANAGLRKTVGKANQITAKAFVIEEGTKGVLAKIFDSQLRGEAAKLTAHKAQMDAIEAQAAKAQAAMLAYTGTVLAYDANVENVKNVFARYEASARATIEQNNATRAEIRGQAARYRGLASLAGRQAASASVEAIRKMRLSENNSANYTDASLQNDNASYEIARTLSSYAQATQQVRIDAQMHSTRPEAIADIGQAISRFTRTALDSAGRAARMAQGANESLARAYATAYEAAGRAGAQVASGKLSGFRASASISAAGTVSAARNQTTSESFSANLTYGESDTSTQTISV